MGKGKRHNPTDRTAKDALDHIEGKVKEVQLSSLAKKLQRQQRIREELHRRQQQLKARPDGDDAA